MADGLGPVRRVDASGEQQHRMVGDGGNAVGTTDENSQLVVSGPPPTMSFSCWQFGLCSHELIVGLAATRIRNGQLSIHVPVDAKRYELRTVLPESIVALLPMTERAALERRSALLQSSVLANGGMKALPATAPRMITIPQAIDGVTSIAMGSSERGLYCTRCVDNMVTCQAHQGALEFLIPVAAPQMVSEELLQVLSCVCHTCYRGHFTAAQEAELLQLDVMKRLKRASEMCKSVRYCGELRDRASSTEQDRLKRVQRKHRRRNMAEDWFDMPAAAAPAATTATATTTTAATAATTTTAAATAATAATTPPPPPPRKKEAAAGKPRKRADEKKLIVDARDSGKSVVAAPLSRGDSPSQQRRVRMDTTGTGTPRLSVSVPQPALSGHGSSGSSSDTESGDDGKRAASDSDRASGGSASASGSETDDETRPRVDVEGDSGAAVSAGVDGGGDEGVGGEGGSDIEADDADDAGGGDDNIDGDGGVADAEVGEEGDAEAEPAEVEGDMGGDAAEVEVEIEGDVEAEGDAEADGDVDIDIEGDGDGEAAIDEGNDAGPVAEEEEGREPHGSGGEEDGSDKGGDGSGDDIDGAEGRAGDGDGDGDIDDGGSDDDDDGDGEGGRASSRKRVVKPKRQSATAVKKKIIKKRLKARIGASVRLTKAQVQAEMERVAEEARREYHMDKNHFWRESTTYRFSFLRRPFQANHHSCGAPIPEYTRHGLNIHASIDWPWEGSIKKEEWPVHNGATLYHVLRGMSPHLMSLLGLHEHWSPARALMHHSLSIQPPSVRPAKTEGSKFTRTDFSTNFIKNMAKLRNEMMYKLAEDQRAQLYSTPEGYRSSVLFHLDPDHLPSLNRTVCWVKRALPDADQCTCDSSRNKRCICPASGERIVCACSNPKFCECILRTLHPDTDAFRDGFEQWKQDMVQRRARANVPPPVIPFPKAELPVDPSYAGAAADPASNGRDTASNGRDTASNGGDSGSNGRTAEPVSGGGGTAAAGAADAPKRRSRATHKRGWEELQNDINMQLILFISGELNDKRQSRSKSGTVASGGHASAQPIPTSAASSAAAAAAPYVRTIKEEEGPAARAHPPAKQAASSSSSSSSSTAPLMPTDVGDVIGDVIGNTSSSRIDPYSDGEVRLALDLKSLDDHSSVASSLALLEHQQRPHGHSSWLTTAASYNKQAAKSNSLQGQQGGKWGRFRGGMGGKRVNFTLRGVIIPAGGMLDFDEVGLPMSAKKVLSYPETLNEWNMAYCMDRCRQREVNYLRQDRSTDVMYLASYINCNTLTPATGTILECQLTDGIQGKFGRQPTIKEASLQSKRAKFYPTYCILEKIPCNYAYNADHDGDEMTEYIDISEESKAESMQLSISSRQLACQHGSSITAGMVQNASLALFRITQRGAMFTRTEMVALVSQYVLPASLRNMKMNQDAEIARHFLQYMWMPGGLPPPAISVGDQERWTGSQLVSLFLPLDFFYGHSVPETYDAMSSSVVIRKGQLWSGTLNKTQHTGPTSHSIGHVMLHRYGPDWVKAWIQTEVIWNRYIDRHPVTIHPVQYQMKNTEYKTLVLQCLDRFLQMPEHRTYNLVHPNDAERSIRDALDKVTETVAGEYEYGLREENATLITQPPPSRIDLRARILDTGSIVPNDAMALTDSATKGTKRQMAHLAAIRGQEFLTPEQGRYANYSSDYYKTVHCAEAAGFNPYSLTDGMDPRVHDRHNMEQRGNMTQNSTIIPVIGYGGRRTHYILSGTQAHHDRTVRGINGIVHQRLYGDDGFDPSRCERNELQFFTPWDHASLLLQKERAELMRWLTQHLYHETELAPRSLVLPVHFQRMADEQYLAAASETMLSAPNEVRPVQQQIRVRDARVVDCIVRGWFRSLRTLYGVNLETENLLFRTLLLDFLSAWHLIQKCRITFSRFESLLKMIGSQIGRAANIVSASLGTKAAHASLEPMIQAGLSGQKGSKQTAGEFTIVANDQRVNDCINASKKESLGIMTVFLREPYSWSEETALYASEMLVGYRALQLLTHFSSYRAGQLDSWPDAWAREWILLEHPDFWAPTRGSVYRYPTIRLQFNRTKCDMLGKTVFQIQTYIKCHFKTKGVYCIGWGDHEIGKDLVLYVNLDLMRQQHLTKRIELFRKQHLKDKNFKKGAGTSTLPMSTTTTTTTTATVPPPLSSPTATTMMEEDERDSNMTTTTTTEEARAAAQRGGKKLSSTMITEAAIHRCLYYILISGIPQVTAAWPVKLARYVEANPKGADAQRKPLVRQEEWGIKTQGSNFEMLARFPHMVAMESCHTTFVWDVMRMWGPEAARVCIERTLDGLVRSVAGHIDVRHVKLIADFITTYSKRGKLSPITRKTLKESDSNNPLRSAGFEEIVRRLKDGAVCARRDMLQSTIAATIVGNRFLVGTGSVVVRPTTTTTTQTSTSSAQPTKEMDTTNETNKTRTTTTTRTATTATTATTTMTATVPEPDASISTSMEAFCRNRRPRLLPCKLYDWSFLRAFSPCHATLFPGVTPETGICESDPASVWTRHHHRSRYRRSPNRTATSVCFFPSISTSPAVTQPAPAPSHVGLTASSDDIYRVPLWVSLYAKHNDDPPVFCTLRFRS